MGYPVITKESQMYYERVSSAFSQRDTTPELCGYYGRACRQMEKAEGANRALCFGCPLVKMQEALDNRDY